MTDKVSLLLCLCQVALSVAAEFWEQGDLERTVLEQQPIVCSKPILFCFFNLSSKCLCLYVHSGGFFLISL